MNTPTWAFPLFFAVITRALPMVYGVFFLFLAVRKTPIDEYGQYAAMISGYAFLILLVRAFLFMPLVRIRTRNEKVSGAEAGTLIVGTITAVIVSFLGWAITSIVVRGTEWEPIKRLLYFLPYLTALASFREFFLFVLLSERETRSTALIEFIFFGGMALSLLCFDPFGIPWNAVTLLLNWLVFMTISTITAWFLCKPLIVWNGKEWKNGFIEVIRIGKLSGPGSLLHIALSQADTMWFSLFTNPVEIGKYAAVRLILRAFEGLSSALNMVLLPTFSKMWEDKKIAFIRKRTLQLSAGYALFIFIIILFCAITKDLWLPFVYGNKLKTAEFAIYGLLNAILFLTVLEGIYSISQNTLFACGGERELFQRAIPLWIGFWIVSGFAVHIWGSEGGASSMAFGYIGGILLNGSSLWKRWNTILK
ncbi:MAG: hypothetical protein N2450_06150 [bacterium]|nr:hypothetical protein [bacterium]